MKKLLFALLAVAMMFTACEEEWVDVDQLAGLSVSEYNGFSGLTAVRNEAGDLDFEVKFVYDASVWVNFDSFKFYYTINKAWTDAEFAEAIELDDAGITPNLIEDHRVSMEIEVPAADNMYAFTIPYSDIAVGDDLRFYFRGYTKDAEGEKNKMYYTPVGNETFEKDNYSEWTVLTVK